MSRSHCHYCYHYLLCLRVLDRLVKSLWWHFTGWGFEFQSGRIFTPYFLLFNPFCKKNFPFRPLTKRIASLDPKDRRHDLCRRDNTSRVVCTYYAWQLRWHRRGRTLGATNLGAKICAAELPAITPPLLSLWPLFPCCRWTPAACAWRAWCQDLLRLRQDLWRAWFHILARVVFVAKARPSALRHAWFQDLLDWSLIR